LSEISSGVILQSIEVADQTVKEFKIRIKGRFPQHVWANYKETMDDDEQSEVFRTREAGVTIVIDVCNVVMSGVVRYVTSYDVITEKIGGYVEQ
jgi:hypothetical protein